MNKKELAMLLSKLETFKDPYVSLEQYQTDAEIAAHALWFIEMSDGFSGKVVADLGCGVGTLGIGALVLGAKKVYFVEIDKEVVSLLKKNLKNVEQELEKKFDYVVVNKDIRSFDAKVDLVIQNPPFGVQKAHADRIFLLKAVEISPLIYSFHKLESAGFILKFSKDHGFSSELCAKLKFPLRKSMVFHDKKVHYIDVGLWKIERFKNSPL